MNLQLNGQVALVTCASSGVGRACVERLLEEGADVVATSRSVTVTDFPEAVETGRLRVVPADLMDGPAFEASIDNALAALPAPPSILVFVPVREPNVGLQATTPDLILEAVDHALLRFLFLARRLMPSMRHRRFGRIVTILGASTMAPLSDHLPANVSRIAVASAAAGLSREFAAENICANNILMGPFDTPGIRNVWESRAHQNGMTLEELTRTSVERVPAKRLGRLDECGRLCALLCSPTMGFLTGQSLRMDGGVNLSL